MLNWRFVTIMFLLISVVVLCHGAEIADSNNIIRVACIGDSITYGSTIADREQDSYPAQLGRMLGDRYECRNFGVSGATMLKRGDKPYWNQTAFAKAQEWNPDIVVIKLGTNDTKPQNWQYASEYGPDYLAMIDVFKSLSSRPRIWVCMPVPAYPGRWGITDAVVREGVIPIVREVAENAGVKLIDLYHPFVGQADLFPDTVHPNAAGAKKIAEIVCQAIQDGDRSAVQMPGTVSSWNGYVQYDFTLDGRACRVVLPEQMAEGRPWIWRARFWGHEPQTDLALLARGFAVAYMDVANLYGAPQAVEHWNKFYDFFVNEQGFNPKPALEGMSRGGLIIYNWAAANPDKVACIYADAPVCDIASWPGGKGDGPGSASDWKRCLEAYGLTEETARAFKGNPIDHLQPLAAAGVPLLHICGAVDEVVPVAENTAILKQRYEDLGGSIRLINKPGVKHHPHSLKDPAVIVEFIMQHTLGIAPTITLRADMGNSGLKFQSEKLGRVAFLGGSITEMEGYRPRISQTLSELFPETRFEFINAGIGSTCSTTGAFRLNDHVLSKGPIDLLFVEFAVNDNQDAHHTETECMRGIEGIIRHALQVNPNLDIVLLYTANESHIADYQQGKIPQEIAAHERVARAYGVSSINLAASVAARMKAGEFNWNTFGGVHPADYGNELYADLIGSFLRCHIFASDRTETRAAFYPAPSLDKFSYSNGILLPINQARPVKGFEITIPDWSGIPGHTRSHYNKIPLLCGTQPGDEFELSFNGTAIGLYVVAGPDAGCLQYRIDNGDWKIVNLYHKHSAGLHYPRTCMLADELEGGDHQLTVRISEASDARSHGNAVRIVAFAVNPKPIK